MVNTRVPHWMSLALPLAAGAAVLVLLWLGGAVLCFVWIGRNLRPSRASIHPARSPVPGHGLPPQRGGSGHFD